MFFTFEINVMIHNLTTEFFLFFPYHFSFSSEYKPAALYSIAGDGVIKLPGGGRSSRSGLEPRK